jgi:glutamate--cysteine ligase
VPSSSRSLTVARAADLVTEWCTGEGGPDRVGLELEWLTVRTSDGGQPDLATLEAVMAATAPPAGSRLTLEPGGQLEVSAPPFDDVASSITATTGDAAALEAAAHQAGLSLLARGSVPQPRDRLLHTPRYDAMEAWYDTRDPAGRWMMRNTAALQVNVSTGPPDRWHAAVMVGPTLVAAFANSPAPGWKSARMGWWMAMDPQYTVSPADWATQVLDAPVMLIRVADDDFRAMPAARPFRQWITDGHELGFPTEDDLAYHVTTLFPPVRCRGWLELRMLDALPSPWWEVATAVSVANLQDPAVARYGCAGAEGLWEEAARVGLTDPRLARAATRCFAAAVEALDGDLAEAVRDYADRFVSRGRCPADELNGAPSWA